MSPNTLSRVLCVDDDEDACEMLSALLNSYQIDATCVRTAAEAWPKIKAQSFDLYLLDAWLPQVDGFEFCRQIRKIDSLTPVLFYSGAAYDSDKQKAMAAGANAFVSKPDLDGLIELMVDLIAKAKKAAMKPRSSAIDRLIEANRRAQLTPLPSRRKAFAETLAMCASAYTKNLT